MARKKSHVGNLPDHLFNPDPDPIAVIQVFLNSPIRILKAEAPDRLDAKFCPRALLELANISPASHEWRVKMCSNIRLL